MANRRDYGSGTIEERSSRRWRITVEYAPDPRNGKRRRRRFSIQGNKRDAQRALRDALTERDQGIDVAPDKITVGEWLTAWLPRHRAETDITAATYQRYEIAIRVHIVPTIGHVRLRDLRRDHVADLKASWLTGEARTLSRPQAPATVKKQLTVLRQALAAAESADLIARNPAAAVKSPPLPTDGEKRALTEDEIRALLEAAAGTRHETPIRFTLATGLRQGELLGLLWSDVDLETGVAHIRRSLTRTEGLFNEPKAHSRRTLELSPATVEVLRRHRVAQREQRLKTRRLWGDDGLLFPSSVGTPWLARNFYRDFKCLVVAGAEIDDKKTVTWHCLRHTAASHWLMAGVTPFEVARRLGHSSTSITERVYAHLLPGGQEKSARALDHLVG